MRTGWKLGAGAIAAAGLVAAPASVATAGVRAPLARSPLTVTVASPLAPCYDSVKGGGATIPVSVTGGTPGDNFSVEATYPAANQELGNAGNAEPTAPFDANGDGSATLTGVFPNVATEDPLQGRPVDIEVQDFPADGGTPAVDPVGATLITNLAININTDSPRRASLRHSVAVSGTAFAGQKLYGFVLNAKRTKLLRRFYLGTGNACGFVEHKEYIVPKHFSTGRYWMYVNAGPKLNKPTALSAEYSVDKSYI